MTERRGRRSKQLLDKLKETRGYWKLKDEALDRSLQNSHKKRLWTCRKAGCRTNDRMYEWNYVIKLQTVIVNVQTIRNKTNNCEL